MKFALAAFTLASASSSTGRSVFPQKNASRATRSGNTPAYKGTGSRILTPANVKRRTQGAEPKNTKAGKAMRVSVCGKTYDGPVILEDTLICNDDNNSEPAITLVGEYASLDCQDNTIFNLLDFGTTIPISKVGIRLEDGAQVKNCLVTNFAVGADIVSGDGSTISGSEFVFNVIGVKMDSTYSVSIKDSKIEYNSRGIVAEPSSGSSSNALSIFTATAAHINITDVSVSRSSLDGMYLNGAESEFSITGAEARNNVGNGITVLKSKVITIKDGAASNNGGSGITVLEADEVQLDKMNFDYNTGNGVNLHVEGATIIATNLITNENGVNGFESDTSRGYEPIPTSRTFVENLISQGNGRGRSGLVGGVGLGLVFIGNNITLKNCDVSNNELAGFGGNIFGELYVDGLKSNNMQLGVGIESPSRGNLDSITWKNVEIRNNTYSGYLRLYDSNDTQILMEDIVFDSNGYGLSFSTDVYEGPANNISMALRNFTASNSGGTGIVFSSYNSFIDFTFEGDIVASSNSENGISIIAGKSQATVAVEGDVTTNYNGLVGFNLNENVNVTLGDGGSWKACGNNGTDIGNKGNFFPESLEGYTCDGDISCRNKCPTSTQRFLIDDEHSLVATVKEKQTKAIANGRSLVNHRNMLAFQSINSSSKANKHISSNEVPTAARLDSRPAYTYNYNYKGTGIGGGTRSRVLAPATVKHRRITSETKEAEPKNAKAGKATRVSACGKTYDGPVILEDTLICNDDNNSEPAITLVGEYASLDCQDNTITNLLDFGTTIPISKVGIRLEDGAQVKNCLVTNFAVGADIVSGDGSTISGSEFVFNVIGVKMDSSYSVSIEDSKIEYNSRGIVAEPSSSSSSRALSIVTATAAHINITNILVSGNGYGMYLNGAESEFSITGAEARNNLGDGIAVLAADEVQIVSSQAVENNGYGMLLNSNLITVKDSITSHNGRSGVVVLEADEVHMEELTLERNGFGVFSNQVATRDGMVLHGKNITVNNVFTAYNSGSGIDVLNADDLQLNGVTAFQNNGDGLYLSGKLINIMNSDLISNTPDFGAGVYVQKAETLYLENVIASNNTGLEFGVYGVILWSVDSVYAKNLVTSNNTGIGITTVSIHKYASFQNVTASGNGEGMVLDVSNEECDGELSIDIDGFTGNDNVRSYYGGGGLRVFGNGGISIKNAIANNNLGSDGIEILVLSCRNQNNHEYDRDISIQNATANNNLGSGLFIIIFDGVNVTLAEDIIASGNLGNGIEIYGSSSDWENPVKGQVTVDGNIITNNNELVGFLLNQTNADVNVTLTLSTDDDDDDDATLGACDNNGFDIQNDNENNGTGTFLPKSLVGYTCDDEIECDNKCPTSGSSISIFERHLRSPAVLPHANVKYATELTSIESAQQIELERQRVHAEEVYQKKMQMLEELRAELANLIEVSTKL